MAWIDFNGVSSADMGVIVELMPEFGKAGRKYESEDIAGVDGTLDTLQDAWYPVESSVTINCFGGSTTPNDIYKWLDGVGYLRTSDDETKKRKVKMHKPFTQKRLRLGEIYDSISVPIIGDPFQYEASQTEITLSNPASITGKGDVFALPTVTVTGVGDVDLLINGTAYMISFGNSSKTVVIDSKSKFAYSVVNSTITAASLAGVEIELMSDDESKRWATLKCSGTNGVSWSGSVSSAKILPNWRWF